MCMGLSMLKKTHEGVKNVEKLAVFLLGMAAGIAWYKSFIKHLLGRFVHTTCDYCQFRIEKEKLFPKKKKRSTS